MIVSTNATYLRFTDMNNTSTWKNKELSVLEMFFIPIILGITASLCSLLMTQGHALDGTVYLQGDNRFMDFFNHIVYARDLDATYSATFHACFPPLAYLFYHLLSILLPEDTYVVSHALDIGSYGLFAYFLFVIVALMVIHYLIKKICHQLSDENRLCIMLAFIFSYSTLIGCIERGNNILYVAACLLAAIYLKDSPSRYKREMALILIAIAATLKIYPAVFGILYLYEKRFKEALRLILYGILFFFVPFLWVGGLNGIRLFFANQAELQLDLGEGNFQCIGELVGMFTQNRGVILTISLLCMGLFLILAKLQSTPWKRYVLLVACMVFVPLWSGAYTLTYFLIPLLFFLNHTKTNAKRMDSYYALVFGMLFSLTIIPFEPELISWAHFVSYAAAYLLVFLVCCETVYTISKKTITHS